MDLDNFGLIYIYMSSTVNLLSLLDKLKKEWFFNLLHKSELYIQNEIEFSLFGIWQCTSLRVN